MGIKEIKDAVESRGGKIDGVLNIRLAWDSTDDYDLHCVEPNQNHIYYSNLRTTHSSSGRLDLDANGRDGIQPKGKIVENITYSNKSKMPLGEYLIYVHNYSMRNYEYKGFTIEIEYGDELVSFNYDKIIPAKDIINVCKINFKNGEFNIIPLIPSSNQSKELYGLQTNEFHKVNLVCLSPNHWDTNNVGNKHYLFMLEGCKCPTSIRSFHNENLIAELLNHKRVLEVLGTSYMINPTDKQLSGIGFNSTVKDELIVKLAGSFKRIIKIKF